MSCKLQANVSTTEKRKQMTSLAQLDFENLPYNTIKRLLIPHCPILKWNMFKNDYGAQQVIQNKEYVTKLYDRADTPV